MEDYLKINSNYWSQGVYDNFNPESYVFRIYGRILKYQFGINGDKSENLLDFGCGSAGNTKFFHEKGFNVFGVDQSEVDIERCKSRIPQKKNQFIKINPQCNENDDWFNGTKFKVVTSFQTLYYLNDQDLKRRLISINNMMEPNAIFIATMMHTSSWYYQMSSPSVDGLRFVKFHREQDIGRENLITNDHYINFTSNEEDLVEKFNIFKPIHSKGYYDGVYRDDQGSEKHLVFIGQKR
jgi:SAM-dependent methyltransferase